MSASTPVLPQSMVPLSALRCVDRYQLAVLTGRSASRGRAVQAAQLLYRDGDAQPSSLKGERGRGCVRVSTIHPRCSKASVLLVLCAQAQRCASTRLFTFNRSPFDWLVPPLRRGALWWPSRVTTLVSVVLYHSEGWFHVSIFFI